jgi:hypothetical protein
MEVPAKHIQVGNRIMVWIADNQHDMRVTKITDGDNVLTLHVHFDDEMFELEVQHSQPVTRMQ